MNSNTVLKKILTLLSADTKEEVSFVTAELVDGTVVESATFDVGETVEVVSADGEKTPAPDGEHELFLRDEEGNEVRIRIITQDGVITERENVEELAEEPETEEVEMEEVSEEVEAEEEEKIEEEVSMEIISKTVEEMAYRIEELEKKIAEMQVEEEVKEEIEAEEEEELPKLDGAPVQASKVNVSRKADGRKMDRQSAFLSKLYN
jgi:exosome complex component RRP41